MQSIFGTDGIRGRFNRELNCPLANKIGYSLANKLKNDKPIIIGRDTRLSGNDLFEALSSGINFANKEVINIGICPTPTIPYLIKEIGYGSGIMISASHNPPEFNGIKIFNENGKKLDSNEEKDIEMEINNINKNDLKVPFQIRISHQNQLLKIYEDSLIQSAGENDLRGLKIILDVCHGSATSCAEKVFKTLGANTIVINSKADGSKINLNCGSTCLKPLREAMLVANADMGFSFDGDADRVIGLDSNGNILDGDHILFLLGRELMDEKKLSNNIIISTEMANLGFEKAWKDIGGIFYRTPVGDKFIYKEITKRNADLGGEQSGHILSKINDFSGDGILTAIQIAKNCKRKQISLKSWLKSSFKPFTQKLTNLYLPPLAQKSNNLLNQYINNTIEEIKDKSTSPCRIFIRPSGTEPLLRILIEAENKKLVSNYSRDISNKLENIIKNILVN